MKTATLSKAALPRRHVGQLLSSSNLSRAALSSHSTTIFLPPLWLTTKSPQAAKTLSSSSSTSFNPRFFASSVSLDHTHEKSRLSDRSGNSSSSSSNKNPIPDFNDTQAAYESQSNLQLFRAALVFQLCRIPPLVKHALPLLRLTRRVVGDTVTDTLLRATLFGHFCAGEDEKTLQPSIAALEKAGIGSIMDFAAEDDGSQSHSSKKSDSGHPAKMSRFGAIADEIISEVHPPKVRVYDYESEAKCDRHVKNFQKCIRDVASLSKDGYAAVKITALGNPKLLERMSRAIVEAQNLFAKFDLDGNGFITREEFEHGFHLFFKDDHSKLQEMLEKLHPDESTGLIDYISWSMLLSPRDLPSITSGCREIGPLALATPTEEEVELIEKMYERGHTLAKDAAQHGTRLLIDAEQARFQPAIDNLVLDLQQTYNATSKSDFPVVYNTYQCYLKDELDRLQTDVERSERFGYHFGAKLVRGAYMESERELALTLGYPSPIHDSIEDTHKSYNGSVELLMRHAKKSDKQVEVMLATHNQESVEKAIAVMNELEIDRNSPTVAFAQLYGMKDNLTFNLGRHGYRAYKYVPYGEIKMVMPYLIRRAHENSAIAGGTKGDLDMIQFELKRRLMGGKKLKASS